GPPPISWSAPIGHYHFVGRTGAGEAEGDAVAVVGSSATLRLAIARPMPAAPPAMAMAPTPPAPSDTPAAQIAPPPPARHHHPARVNRPAPPEPPAPLDLPPPPPPVHAFVPPSAPPPVAPAAGGNVHSEPVPETPPIPEPVAVRRDPPRPPPVYDATPAPLEGDSFKQAVRMSRSGLYGQAADLFEAVASRPGSNAGLALYEYGRLQQLHLGHPAIALVAYHRYEREYPVGPLVQEVELSAIELELASKDPDGALAEIDRFLGQFPRGERAPDVHLLRGNLLRERGDYKGALTEYAHARSPRIEDDAMYFSAFCQQQLGRADEAAASLRDYQKRFPAGRHAAEVHRALDTR
ncbi:MAG TPA: tetratricopeptide repeat protein, partial [Myxococcaceae bacterium]|nr:tetratricopeptide repeat protein [Myxococcaceae bacterium]